MQPAHAPDFSAADLPPLARAPLPSPRGELWVFGYGSLMWHPGFEVTRAAKAKLFGYHRRLCLWSTHYRGSLKQPGLVLGLDRGGCCSGMAFLVARKHARAALEYLHAREMITDAYTPVVKTVRLHDGGTVDALAFLSKPEHPQFARRLGFAATLEVVRNAKGAHGQNREYVLNTARRLRELNIECAELHAIAAHLAHPKSSRNP